MARSATAGRPAILDVRTKAAATLLVCSECDAGRRRRREFKSALKAAGCKRDLRVVSCRCLDVCPKHATAAIFARSGTAARPIVIDDAAAPADALALLFR